MTTPHRGPALGLTTLPRAVLSVAAGVVSTVERAMVGDSRMRTAQGNAWEAICADRDLAQRRDEARRLVAAVAAAPPAPATGRTPAGPTTGRTTPAGPTTGRTTPAGPTTGRTTPAGPTTGQVSVGSSPRSSASQACLVAAGPA